MTLLRSSQPAEIEAEAKTPAEPEAPEPARHAVEPPSAQDVRAGTQGFSTGLRSRLGKATDGICW